jgi:hypothetical protein
MNSVLKSRAAAADTLVVSRRIRLTFLVTVVAVMVAAAAPDAGAAKAKTLLKDDFNAQAKTVWADGSTHGAWLARYNGYGTTSVVTDGTNVLQESPQASTSSGETHAGLVTTTKTFSNFDLTLRLKTVKQLRTPTPNPWETGWVLWHFASDQAFYYLALKTNGWELGKVDATKQDPAGPSCVWPSYTNCLYPGAQRYLITSSTPTFPVGTWYRVRIRHVGNAMTFWVNGAQLGSFTDSERAYTSGKIGLYNEDATVRFDDVLVKSA